MTMTMRARSLVVLKCADPWAALVMVALGIVVLRCHTKHTPTPEQFNVAMRETPIKRIADFSLKKAGTGAGGSACLQQQSVPLERCDRSDVYLWLFVHRTCLKLEQSGKEQKSQGATLHPPLRAKLTFTTVKKYDTSHVCTYFEACTYALLHVVQIPTA